MAFVAPKLTLKWIWYYTTFWQTFHSRVSNVSNWYSPLMSTTLKLQTDVTSPIYPSFLNFFASMPPISPSTFFASTVDKIFQKNFNFHDVIPHHASLIFTIMQTTPTHTYSKLGYIIAQHMEIACVHGSINRSINSRLLENWFCLAFFASIIEKKVPPKNSIFMTSYLIIIHDASLIFTIMLIKPRLLIHIQTIMQIQPDPWPLKRPLTPMNIHRFYRSITSYPLFKKSIKYLKKSLI